MAARSGDIGGDRDGATAGLLDLALHGGKPVHPPRDQRHRRAGFRQHLREAHAKPARRAGDQRHLAGQI
jgi:hypothetical protein